VRRAATERLVRCDIDVLLVNVIFQEGVDIPDLKSVVIATGGASPIASLQRIGRGMRATKTKSTFEVWEIADAGCGCTRKTKEEDPDNYHPGCQWLTRHWKERLKAYREEEYDVELIDDDALWVVP
jgi:superfamily II DNA or RNA helicase